MTKRIRFRIMSIALATAVAGAGVSGSSVLAPRAQAQSPLTSVIVELKRDPVVVARAKAQAAGLNFNEEAHRQQVIAEQQRFLDKLTLAGVPYVISGVTAPNGPVTPTLQFRFNYVYNGLALEVPQQALPILTTLEEVLSVHPNEPVQVHLDRAVDYTRASNLYGNPPRLTQFDTLDTGGLEGEGVNIAVLDTGVDWSHEMFGGDPTPPQYGAAPNVAALNPNRKVIYYMNFTPAAEADDFGHGTHVAGDAAGYRGFAPGPDGLPLTADDIAIHGVAPQAKIMAYKVLTAAGAGVSASIVSAIEDAVQPRTITGQPKPVAHVINLSLGGAGGPDSPNSVACDNAALAGAIVVASAGNSGVGSPANQAAQLGTIGQPAAGRRVIAVGANIDPGSAPSTVDLIGGGQTNMKAFMMDGSAPINADITNNYVFCGLGDTPDQFPDSVSGKIALIQRGSTATAQGQGTGQFAVKATLATARGAVAVLIYNNVDGELTATTTRRAAIPVLGMSKANGEYLRSILGSTAFGAVSAQQIRINRLGQFEPIIADFSSRGPVQGFGQVKPDLTAPGVSILSGTVAVGGVQTDPNIIPPPVGWMFDPTRYVSASGTSFSGPVTAGIAALIRQRHPSWTPSMVRAALVNTATNLRDSNGIGLTYGANTINEQGGGLVDGLAAVNAKALMGVGQPATAGQPQGRTFGIFVQPSAGNPDFTPSYSFGQVPIAGVIGAATISQEVRIFDVTAGSGAGDYWLTVEPVRGVDQNGFTVSTTDAIGNPISSVSVPVGGMASFFVKTQVDGQLVTASPTQAQWYISATSTGGQSLRMPFYYRAVRPNLVPGAPSLAPADNTEVSGSPLIDANGSYSLSYSFTESPAPSKFRIEEQKDNDGFAVLGDVPASQTTFNITDRGNGLYSYRVAGLFAVQYGLLQGPYSGVQAVQVDRRLESDVTSLIQTAVSNVSFAAAVFEFDQTLKNTTSSTTILPPLRFNITAIQSATGTVRASNADSAGDGVASAAQWDYSNTLGADRALTAGETSGTRHLKFTDPASELFTFTAVIKGNFPDPAFATMSAGAGGEPRRFRLRLRFIADPAARSVRLAGSE